MSEIVYKVPGKNHGPGSKTYDWLGVHSKEEYEQAIEDGWFNTLDEAVKGKSSEKERARNNDGEFVGDDPATPFKDEAYQDVAPTRDEMEAKAKELKISFKRRISDKDLMSLIEAKTKG